MKLALLSGIDGATHLDSNPDVRKCELLVWRPYEHGLQQRLEIFYLLGMPFDKKVFDLDYEMNVLAEEILESIATFWMFISALVSTLYFRVAAPRD